MKNVRLVVRDKGLPTPSDVMEVAYTTAGNIPPLLLQYISICVKRGQLVEIEEIEVE